MFKIVSEELPFEVNEEGVVRHKKTKRVYSVNLNKKGYRYITTKYKTVPCFRLVHRLIALAFIPNPENKPQVNHKDGVKDNNRKTNLEWCTQFENMQHVFATGLVKTVTGEQHYLAIHKRDDVEAISLMIQEGKSYRQIMDVYNVTAAFLADIKIGHSWKDVTKNFNFPSKPCKRIPEEAVKFICEKLEEGLSSNSIPKLGYKTPFSQNTVWKIKTKKRHTNISKHYNF